LWETVFAFAESKKAFAEHNSGYPEEEKTLTKHHFGMTEGNFGCPEIEKTWTDYHFGFPEGKN